jgi:hypothetical protein
MPTQKATTLELSGGGDSGALMKMVILGAAAAFVSIPSGAVFLVNKLTRKCSHPRATNQLQSVVGSPASDDDEEPLENQHQQIEQPPIVEERIAEPPLSLMYGPEDKTLDDVH